MAVRRARPEGGLAALTRLRSDPRLRLLLAWYLPYWIVCELLPTKLPHYVLPAYPALLLLMGWYFDRARHLAVAPRWQVWLGHAARFGVIIVTVGTCRALAIGLPIYLRSISPSGRIPCAIAFCSPAGWVRACVRLSPLGRRGRARRSRRSRSGFSASVLPRLDALWPGRQIAQAFAAIDRARIRCWPPPAISSRAWSS